MYRILLLLSTLMLAQFYRAAVIPPELSHSDMKEKQDVIEGDIIVDNELKRIVDMAAEDRENKHVRRRRDTIMYHQKRWKDAIVPYVIDPSVGRVTRRAIALAFIEFHRSTCLWFTPRKNETDYIRIVKGEGCYSKVGRQGGEQLVSLGDGCAGRKNVLHELMHAIGFFHENSRYDRDSFVKVLWWNIIYGAEKNFLTYNHGIIDTLRMPYDIHSLMHYDNKAFTKNFGDTMQAKENPTESLGGKTFSKIDLKQVYLLYKCKKPRYRVRKDRCKDRMKTGCFLFMAYPHLCNIHKHYTRSYCHRTCRVCEP
ncbi:zinc metalloproteinase nas-4-like [Rhopilema esculentum]|uniref:zinc metalloproteinase nas-4-like n=1 Tax=Rhopilema esculentum TaxID=499914 RepID=UPI0031DEE0C8